MIKYDDPDMLEADCLAVAHLLYKESNDTLHERNDSTTDQLEDMLILANMFGLYRAADTIGSTLNRMTN